MENFRGWTFSEEAHKRLENLCSQMPDGNIEQENPALAWLFRNIFNNMVENEVKQASSCISWPNIYYEPGTNEIYSEEFYNRYDKVLKDAKEKLNVKKEIKMETNAVPVDDVFENAEAVETKKKNSESEMEVNECADIEETVCLLVNKLNINDQETNEIENLVRGLSETDLATAVSHCWPQLGNDSVRLNFCSVLAKVRTHSVILCRNALLPWVQAGLGLTVEPLSKIITLFPDVACKEVIAPLLASESSPLVNDLFTLKDLMANLKPEHWTLVLREFALSVGNELQKWHIPVLTMLIEQSLLEKKNIHDILNQVISSMASVTHHFAENREFGTLMITVIQCLDQDSPAHLVSHMTVIVQQYKGMLRFKASKLIKSISK